MRPRAQIEEETASKVSRLWGSLAGMRVSIGLRYSAARITGQLVYASPSPPYILVIRREPENKITVVNWAQVAILDVLDESHIRL